MVETRRLSRLEGEASAGLGDLPPGPVVVALSGGADSSACAWLLLRADRDVRAIHVHHGLPDSDMLAGAASAVAGKLDIPIRFVRIEPIPGPSFEGRARTERYAVLSGELASGELLATGHTRDDQAETVLMHLVRGAGLDGLAGIPAVRPPVVRPLLGLRRFETRELATLAGLPWRDDPANLDGGALRNRVRREVLPALERTFNPGIVESLARTAEIAAAETAVLEDLATAIPSHERAGAVRLPAGHLLAVPRPVAARVLRGALRRLGAEHPPPAVSIDRLLALAAATGGSVPVAEGTAARRSGPWIVVERSDPWGEEAPRSRQLVPPGSVRWRDLRLEFTVGRRPPALPLSPSRLVVPLDGEPSLEVRAAEAADRLGGRRVAAVLADAGVPSAERRNWPVVLLDGRLVWVPGVRRAGSPPRSVDRYLVGVASEEPTWRPSAP